MIQWRFSSSNAALESLIGRRDGGAIKGQGAGCLLYGPYLDIPPGRLSARIGLAPFAAGHARADLTADRGRREITSRQVELDGLDQIELMVDISEALEQFEVRLFCDADAAAAITGVDIDLIPTTLQRPLAPNRPVGFESRKTYLDKVESGFFDKYVSGDTVIEVGYKGYISGTVPIVPHAIGVDLGYPGYDGSTLPFADCSVDAIYSSHCFEHIPDYRTVLRDWYRLLKVGGHMVIVVPHQYLFEKRRNLPSPGNPDHKRFYTPESLTREIAESLDENGYRIRHLAENDRDFNYTALPRDPALGCYELECVIEKIDKPFWNLDDGSVRAYAASEFLTDLPRPDPWTITLDPDSSNGRIWGPYIALGMGDYSVDFYLDPGEMTGSELRGEMRFDIARDAQDGESKTFSGVEGWHALQRGRVTIDFTNKVVGSVFEFRVRFDKACFAGTPYFKGAVLRYQAAA